MLYLMFADWVVDLKKSNSWEEVTEEINLSAVYQNYNWVFSEREANILFSHEDEHKINFQNSEQSLHWSLYSMFIKKLNELCKYLENKQQKDWIRSSLNSVDASVLFAKKSDDSLWLCIDYWKLNEITVKNCYSLSRIDELLNRLSEVKIFTKLNLCDIYHQIRICCDNEWKTAFCTHYEHFKYLIMLFDLINALTIFQVYINQIMCNILDVYCIVYLNDILIYFKNEEKHEKHVQEVLHCLNRHQLFVKLLKCEFYKTAVWFLEYIMKKDDIWMNFSKLNIIQNWSKSETVHNLQVFLKFVDFFWRFIHQYSVMTVSLIELLKENKKSWIHLNKVVKQTFQNLKNVFEKSHVLTHFDSEKKILIITDVSEYTIAVILLQSNETTAEEQNIWRLVAFHSRKCIKMKRRYNAHDSELFTIREIF